MREIMFRGKVDDGEWVFGDFIREPFGYCIQVVTHSGNEYSRKKYVITEETVGQYTGLKDKNGKRIFEGDIVEGADFTAEDGGYGVVGFDDGAFEIIGNNCCGTFHENYWGRDFEVIGNIHDNPELLEEENNETD